MLRVLNYLGIAVTGVIALLALFFEFTKTTQASGRKTLNLYGWIAVGITVISLIVSILSAILTDRDARAEQARADEHISTLQTELTLAGSRVREIRIELNFDDTFDWREFQFLEEASKQFLELHVASGATIFWHWRLHKDRSWVLTDKERSVDFIETRPAIIREFFEQNESPVRQVLPDELTFTSSLDRLTGLPNPRFLILDSTQTASVPMVSTMSGSRLETEAHALKITADTYVDFKEIFGTRVACSFGAEAVDGKPIANWSRVTVDDARKRIPSISPFIDHLSSMEIFINGRRFAQLYRSSGDIKTFRFSPSQWDVEHGRYRFALPEVALTREAFLSAFRADKDTTAMQTQPGAKP